MARWKGTVSKSFSPDAFDQYVSGLSFIRWKPQFVVLHNTESPTFAEWHTVSGADRMAAFTQYYRNECGWSAGPHLFIADDLIWVFTPLTLRGVHSPSWNEFAWGVEVVGNYDSEPFLDPVKNNALRALVTLHAARGIDPDTLRLHKEDPMTNHKHCPGRAINRDELVADVKASLGERAARQATRVIV